MARNPFEQLQDLASEPRQAFEEIVTFIVKCLYPHSRRVRVHWGDGGIDTYTGRLGERGEVDVYQVKYFPATWGDSQKAQIRESYERARQSKEYRLKRWTLCVPTRLRKEDLRWFDEWRSEQACSIELMDGDDLSKCLDDDRCIPARSKLREWGVLGLKACGPQFSVTAFPRKENYEKTGLTAVVHLQLDNRGDRSARGLQAIITHAETGCVACSPCADWGQSPSDRQLKPWVLLSRTTLNPGERSVILPIALCDRTQMPFAVSIKLTAEDCPPSEFHCQLSNAQIASGKPVPFSPGPLAASLETPSGSESLRVFPPSSPAAKELLEMILKHPVAEQRGLTEILGDSPSGALDVLFFPSTVSTGFAHSIKRSVLRAGTDELVRLGWLLPPEEGSAVRVYELNPDAVKTNAPSP